MKPCNARQHKTEKDADSFFGGPKAFLFLFSSKLITQQKKEPILSVSGNAARKQSKEPIRSVSGNATRKQATFHADLTTIAIR